MTETVYYRFTVRRGTAANLASVNETPLDGEFILETDTQLLKMGDGATAYNSLPYLTLPPAPLVLTTLSNVSGVVDIDCSLGDYFKLLLTANVTSITFSNLPATGFAKTIVVYIKQDGTGGWTCALPASFKPIDGTDTAIQLGVSAVTVLTIQSFDQGTRWEYVMKAGGA